MLDLTRAGDDAALDEVEAPARRQRTFLDLTVLVVAFLAVSKGPVFRVRLDVADMTSDLIDDHWVQATFALVYVALIASCWPARARLVADRSVLATQGAFLAVLIASTAWSIATRRTLEQTCLLALGSAAFALAGARFTPRQLLGALWLAMQIGVAASIVVGARDWQWAIDKNGDLAGIYINRNSLGAVTALGMLTSLALVRYLRDAPRDRARIVGLAVVCTAGVVDAWVWYRSASLTPAFALALACIAGVVATLVAPGPGEALRRRVAVVTVTTAGVLAVLAVVARSWLTTTLDRSTTFSGRTEIWSVLWDAIGRRPIAGWGFTAVFFDPTVRADLVARGRDVYEAHSGYVEVLAGAGVIGLLALAAVLVVVCRRVWSAAWSHRGPTTVWFAAATTFVLAANLGETYIGANLLPWMLLVAVSVQARTRR